MAGDAARLAGAEQDAFSQHTPSTQKPEAQFDAVAAVQPSPLPRFATFVLPGFTHARVRPIVLQGVRTERIAREAATKEHHHATLAVEKPWSARLPWLGQWAGYADTRLRFCYPAPKSSGWWWCQFAAVAFVAVTCRRRRLS